MLDAICVLALEIIKPKESLLSTPDHIVNYAGGKYYPYFKDCVGALDGTHIHALPPPERQHLEVGGIQSVAPKMFLVFVIFE